MGDRQMRTVVGSSHGLPAWACIFLLAVAIRVILLALWTSNHPDFYRLTGEIGKVALSLLRTGDFANPYMIPTGPTGHPAPFAPALLALIYHAFGITAAAGYVRALVGIFSHSTLYALMPWLANTLGLSPRAGVFAGVAGALIPMDGLGEIIGLGTTAHASLAFAFLVVAFRRRWTNAPSSVTHSLLLGLACGAAFHILPPLLLVIAGYVLFELLSKRTLRQCQLSACLAAGAFLACGPWTLRNYTALNGLFFIRSNLGLELRIANHPGADADIEVTYARAGTLRHPSENIAEARLVRDLGEAEYNRRARSEALTWIRTNPTESGRLTLLRFLHFWCGPLRYPGLAACFTTLSVLAMLGLRRTLPTLAPHARAVLLIPLVTFPLIYYVVSYVAHYPAPLAWLLLLLASEALTLLNTATTAHPPPPEPSSQSSS